MQEGRRVKRKTKSPRQEGRRVKSRLLHPQHLGGIWSGINLPAERGWVSKNLPQGPMAQPEGRGAGFY